MGVGVEVSLGVQEVFEGLGRYGIGLGFDSGVGLADEVVYEAESLVAGFELGGVLETSDGFCFEEVCEIYFNAGVTVGVLEFSGKTAGFNGGEKGLGLGRGENDLDVVGRFFEEFEKGVLCWESELVCVVEDGDLYGDVGWTNVELCIEFANLFDFDCFVFGIYMEDVG